MSDDEFRWRERAYEENETAARLRKAIADEVGAVVPGTTDDSWLIELLTRLGEAHRRAQDDIQRLREAVLSALTGWPPEGLHDQRSNPELAEALVEYAHRHQHGAAPVDEALADLIRVAGGVLTRVGDQISGPGRGR